MFFIFNDITNVTQKKAKNMNRVTDIECEDVTAPNTEDTYVLKLEKETGLTEVLTYETEEKRDHDYWTLVAAGKEYFQKVEEKGNSDEDED